jgi:hypothetical protein
MTPVRMNRAAVLAALTACETLPVSLCTRQPGCFVSDGN